MVMGDRWTTTMTISCRCSDHQVPAPEKIFQNKSSRKQFNLAADITSERLEILEDR